MSSYRNTYRGIRHVRGLTLIELMIAMVLGLVVVGAATGIFLSNQRTYRATESLSRVQESGRVAFELMAREIREAAGNPCSKSIPVANILNKPGTLPWWMTINGISGYENGALGASAAGTDAIEFLMSGRNAVTVTKHDGNTSNPGSPANFQLNTTQHGLAVGDIIMVCDYTQATILQLNKAANGNNTIEFNKGSAQKPGNCSKGLGLPVDCSPNGSPKSYGPNSIIAKLEGVRWYVADNPRGGRSLYRAEMDKGGDALPGEEITEGVQNMQLEYLIRDSAGYVDAAGIGAAQWGDVVAVRIVLTLLGTDEVGEGRTKLERRLSHVVNLRNRTQ